ncbi:MAG TPA: tetratricopeptide repeat protein [Verrucomicrobiae bacterium]|nr:tetratricopeptide repeat protein [Verrucomicrobiae bacterium]
MTELSQGQRRFLICLCLTLVTAAAYWPVRHFYFVYYDDPQYVAENPRLQEGMTLRAVGWALTTPLDQWMPVTWIARILVRQLFGVDAGTHHLVNLLLHIANTLLLFGVLHRMTRAPWRSALAAALFAVHPLHVESVAWITGLKDVLSTFFGLLTIAAYAQYVEKFTVYRSQFTVKHATLPASRLPVHVYYYALMLVLFALALMAKPMMVTLPFVLLLLDYWPLGRTRWVKSAPTRVSGPATAGGLEVPPSQLLKEKLPLFGLAVASCVVTYWARQRSGAIVSLENTPLRIRVANALFAYVGYLGHTLWPTRLAFLYPLDTNLSLGPATMAGLALIGITTLVLWGARREPWLATGWLWYLGTLVPVIGLVQVGTQLAMADRYTYLPVVGLFLMLAWSVPDEILERRMYRTAATVAAVALLGFYAVLCRVQVGYWKNTETLLRHALQVTKNNWVVQNNLGLFLWRSAKVPEAIEHYEQALRIKPDYAEAHHNLGLALSAAGRLQDAVQQFEQVVRIKPDSAEAHRRLGLALRQAGKPQEATAQFALALRMKPDSAETYNNLGNTFLQAGYFKDAIAQYERSLLLEPNFVDAQNNLAWLLATLAPTDGGDPVRAVALARRACELTNDRMAAYLDTLAAAYAAAGRFNDAVACALRGIELTRSDGQPQLARAIEARLELYRTGRAYHLSRTASGRQASSIKSQPVPDTSPK